MRTLSTGIITLAFFLFLASPQADAADSGQSFKDELALVNLKALERTVYDIAVSNPDAFGKQKDEYLRLIGDYAKSIEAIIAGVNAGKEDSLKQARDVVALKRKILLGNPVLKDFDRILLIRRKITKNGLGLPANFHGNSDLPRAGWDDAIVTLSMRDPAAPLEIVYDPKDGKIMADVKLHFDAGKIMFSKTKEKGRWGLFEMDLAAKAPVEIPLINEDDVDNYDGCYLPDGNLIFSSTATFTGVPCVRGSSHVVNLFRYDREDGRITRLTFDQEHDWCPVVMNSGRVMYLRWEYSDLPHFASRIVFQMNPDGTGQGESYGSNSYWPNSIFYAKPIPDHPTKFVGIVTGHHGVSRMGEMVIFDPAQGRHEADGVVQRIPGYGKKVEPVILDQLVDASWPKFLHPWPLNDKYFLVSCKPMAKSEWGLYLVDVFDNLLLLKEEDGATLFEPIAMKKRPAPPVIPPKVKPGEKTATMYISNIYNGPGLKNVPVGMVKRLRLFTYHFSYYGVGGQYDRVGLDGPWDIKCVLGTVPVEEDGSAMFKVPANTPISIQPLDADGRAVAIMRSWTTAMPGEFQSCAGCHERQSNVPVSRATIAAAKPQAEIKAGWFAPVRGFSFNREVQPVLNRYCVSCHAPGSDAWRKSGNVGRLPDFTVRPPVEAEVKSKDYASWSLFAPSYIALRAFVRTPTIEGDIHIHAPYEFHAATTELVQLLEKGHHNVKLDGESWERLYTWIDLNTPAHGTWHEITPRVNVEKWRVRRLDLLKKYGNRDDDFETVPGFKPMDETAVVPAPEVKAEIKPVSAGGWPFSADEAVKRQKALGEIVRTFDLGNGIKLEMTKIPAGEFVMGSDSGYADEAPRTAAKVVKNFWIGKFEVSNEQYAQFDSKHDSRLERGDFLHFSIRERGFPLNTATQPVCRVSWDEAKSFCKWLSGKTGAKIDLPSEAQWEYACRAGTETPFWYGADETNFVQYANLADKTLSRIETLGWGLPSGCVPDWRPAITNVVDGYRVSAPVGHYKPNPWGLYDMHGNVWEWTGDNYRLQITDSEKKIVRGGSWYDRPKRATSSARLGYLRWQGVYNVGFRVICEE